MVIGKDFPPEKIPGDKTGAGNELDTKLGFRQATWLQELFRLMPQTWKPGCLVLNLLRPLCGVKTFAGPTTD
jgi:hypothetical protein